MKSIEEVRNDNHAEPKWGFLRLSFSPPLKTTTSICVGPRGLPPLGVTFHRGCRAGSHPRPSSPLIYSAAGTGVWTCSVRCPASPLYSWREETTLFCHWPILHLKDTFDRLKWLWTAWETNSPPRKDISYRSNLALLCRESKISIFWFRAAISFSRSSLVTSTCWQSWAKVPASSLFMFNNRQTEGKGTRCWTQIVVVGN